MVDATDLARVKRHLVITDSNQDTLLTEMIADASRALEDFLDTKLEQASVTELHSTVLNQLPGSIWLKRTPVSTLTSVKHSSDGDFTGVSALDSTLVNRFDPETGELFIDAQLTEGFRVLEVVYTGGFATSTANLITNYPNLARAGDFFVAALYKRRNTPNASATPKGRSRSSVTPALEIPKIVKQLAGPFKRLSLEVHG